MAHMHDYDDDGSEDIAQVVELLRRVRLENSELKRNFESLKAIHLQLNAAHQQLQGEHALLYEEKVGRESQLQVSIESLRTELDEKQRQLEAARAQILKPKDVELLKVKILEEVEAPLKQKSELLSKEAESAQQKLSHLRRQHEELQAAFKSLEVRSSTELELQAAEHRATVAELRDKLAQLGIPQARVGGLEAQVRQLERERDKLQFTTSRLQDELAEVRRQKEKAIVEKESVAHKIDKKVKEVQAEELQLHGLVESLTRKNRHLQKELADAHHANEEQFAALMKAQADRSAMHETLEAHKKATALEKQAAAQQYDEHLRRLEEQLEIARRELHDRERQIAELHISHQEQVSRLVEAHDARLSEMEAEAAEKLRAGREQRHELQAKLDALRETCEEYRLECEDFKRKEQMRSTTAEKEAQRLQAAAAEAERQLVGKSMELQQCRKDMDALRSEANTLEVNVAHLTRRREELEAQVTRLHEEVQQGVVNRQALSQELDDAKKSLEVSKMQAVQALEAMRNTAATERAALGRKYQVALQELINKHKEEVKKLQKKIKASRNEVARLMDEVTELRFKSHVSQDIQTWSPAAEPLQPLLAIGTGSPTRLSSPVLDPEILSGIAALKERQQVYLSATKGLMKG